MKILHITNFMGTGGVESFLLNLMEEQSKFHDVSLLTILKKNTYKADDVGRDSKIVFFELNFDKIIDPRILLKLRKAVKENNPDIIHVHLFPAQFIVPVSLLGLGFKIITTEHGISHRRINYRLFHYLEYFGFRLYEKVIGVSSPVSNSLVCEYPRLNNKVETINNGIEIDKVKKAEKVSKSSLSKIFSEDDIVICMVGRLEIGKDYETLIKSLTLLPEQYKLLIVGEGYKRQALEELVSNKNLENRIAFYGFKKNIYYIYQSIDIFVLSSEREGLPMSLLEAMAAGKPCLGSNVDGIRNILDRSDLVFEYKDYHELANKITHLASELDFYSKISENTIKDYSFEKMFIEYEKIYAEISEGVVEND